VDAALEALDSGQARVAEPDGQGGWRVNQWLKQGGAVELPPDGQRPRWTPRPAPQGIAYDKVPLKFAGWGPNRFREAGFRVVPGAVVRRSATSPPASC
jgi:2,3,4,5-tetrahydropyridine-2-carboxylate N-succinyltransferase